MSQKKTLLEMEFDHNTSDTDDSGESFEAETIERGLEDLGKLEEMPIPPGNETFFIDDIDETVENNPHYRAVVFTNNQMQLVYQKLKGGQRVDQEMHAKTTQFFRVEKGELEVVIGTNQKTSKVVKSGGAFIVPAGVAHELVNKNNGKTRFGRLVQGSDETSFYTIYTPKEHPEGQIDRTMFSARKRAEAKSTKTTTKR